MSFPASLSKEELDHVIEFLTDTLLEDGSNAQILINADRDDPRLVPVNNKLSIVQLTASRLRATLIELRIRRATA